MGASLYAMVDGAAPAGTVTEAFAWLATALAVGSAAGAAAAGAVADHAGPSAAFVLAGIAGSAAVLLTLLRARSLGASELSRAAASAQPGTIPGVVPLQIGARAARDALQGGSIAARWWSRWRCRSSTLLKSWRLVCAGDSPVMAAALATEGVDTDSSTRRRLPQVLARLWS